MFITIIAQQIKIAKHNSQDIYSSALFFILFCIICGLGLSEQMLHNNQLTETASIITISSPTIILLGFLLTLMMQTEHIFANDIKSGVMQQYLLLPIATELLVLAKMLGFMFRTLLPLLFITPIAAIIFGIDISQLYYIIIAVALAGPVLIALQFISTGWLIPYHFSNSNAKINPQLMFITTLPFIVPVMLFALTIASGSYEQIATERVNFALIMLIVLNLVIVPLGAILPAIMLRAK